MSNLLKRWMLLSGLMAIMAFGSNSVSAQNVIIDNPLDFNVAENIRINPGQTFTGNASTGDIEFTVGGGTYVTAFDRPSGDRRIVFFIGNARRGQNASVYFTFCSTPGGQYTVDFNAWFQATNSGHRMVGSAIDGVGVDGAVLGKTGEIPVAMGRLVGGLWVGPASPNGSFSFTAQSHQTTIQFLGIEGHDSIAKDMNLSLIQVSGPPIVCPEPAPTLGSIPDGMEPLLEDEFDGTSINSDIWTSSIPSSGSITVADGEATFASGTATSFPAIENSQPVFPCAGDFVFETALKYDEIGPLGNGVQVRKGTAGIFGIWADNGGYGLRVNLLGVASNQIHRIALASEADATVYHTYKLERINGNYSVYVDGDLVLGPFPSTDTPDNLLIGHHPTNQIANNWSDFNLAYARVSAPPPPPPVSLVFEDFSDLSTFKLNGSAGGAVSGGENVLRLTPAANGQAGSAFLKEPVSLACGAAFSAAFSFQITNSGGVSDQDGIGADGLVFIVTQTPNAVGGAGVGIGYMGIPNSIGVEFDTWYNGSRYGDQTGNHVSVNLNGNISNPIGYADVSPRMNNGQLWYAWVDYNGETTTLEMRLSLSPQRPETPTISVVRDLAQSLGESVYVGFSSGTGGAYGNHDIVGLQFNNEYDPVIEVPGPSNGAPVADAGTSDPVEAVSPAGTDVALDGSASTDPDGDTLTYAWSADGIVFDDATSTTPTGSFPVGETTVTLTVDDGNGETATDEVVVTVTDGTAPTLTIPGDITAECTGFDGTPIDIGTASAIDNGDANPVITNNAPDDFAMGTTVVTWTATDIYGNATSADQTVIVEDTTSPDLTVPGDITAEATSPAGASVDLGEASASDICDLDPVITNDGALSVYPLGSTTVTWTATDASNNATSGEQVVNVVDTTPPDVNFSLNTGTLWPPNHKMVQVASGISASDIADENPSVVITVTSDEDINGSGDGNTDVDWEVRNGSVYLRAERDGGQDGRVYTVTVVSTDASGNTTTVTGTVEVPHDQQVASANTGNGKGKSKGKAKKFVVVSQSVTPVLVVGESKVIAGQTSGAGLTQGESVTVVGAGPVVADQLIDLAGNADVASRVQTPVVVNHSFSLSQNHPNPFNPETVIGYALGEASDVRLTIYNVLGQQVRELVNAAQAPGQYQVRWDGRNTLGAQVTSGVYIYRLVAGTQVEMRKMTLLK